MVTLIRSGLLLLLLLSGCGWNGTPTRINDFVPLTSIEIIAELPAIEVSKTIAAQTSTKLTVNGNFSGLFTHDVTDQVVWSSASGVASFPHSTSPNKNRVVGDHAGTAIITAKVGNISATYTLKVSNAAVTSMVITDPSSIPKGRTSQLTVIGTFLDATTSDVTTQDLTFDAVWSSAPGTFATVSNDPASKGLATALTEGDEIITATFGSKLDTTTLTVTAPVLQSIALTPANPSILTLSTKNFTATGTYSDGLTHDITSLVAWSSSDTDKATIAGDGTVTTLTQGTTTIRATLGGVSQSTTLKATGGNLASLAVSLNPPILVKGTTGRIAATGTFSNGSIRDITGMVTWKVAEPSRATVTTPEGNLAWLNALEVTSGTIITATYGSLTPATATLTVTAPPQLQSMTLSLTSLELAAGTSSPLTVEATYSDNTRQNVTANSDWKSSDETIATVGTSGLDAGRVTGVAAGVATGAINATYTYNGTTVSVPVPTRATVTVKAPTLLSLTISPVTSTVAPGYSTSFTAMANYGDGTQVIVTNDAKWAWVVDTPNVAIKSDSVNQPGQVVGVDIGSAKLTASFGGKTPTQAATITVTGP
jgi:hypothetical protein